MAQVEALMVGAGVVIGVHGDEFDEAWVAAVGRDQKLQAVAVAVMDGAPGADAEVGPAVVARAGADLVDEEAGEPLIGRAFGPPSGSDVVTCDVDNMASRKVIEANGGILDDRRGEKLRFWISTG